MLKRNAKILGWVISLSCLWFFFVHARQSFATASISLSAAAIFRAMSASMIPYLGAYAASAVAWYCLLRMVGLRPSLRRSSGIYLSTQIAKYLPGNIGQHIGRVYMSSAYGLPPFRIGLTIAFEMGLVILVATVLSLPLAPALMTWVKPKLNLPISTIGAVCAGIIAIVAIIYWARDGRFLKLARIHAGSAWREALAHRAVGYLPAAILLIGLAMVFAAISLSLLVPGIDLTTLDTPTLAKGLALFSAAWIAGFVTPGAPAGLGVREAILLTGLESIVDQQTAFEATIMFRGISIMADLTALAVGTLLLRAAKVPPVIHAEKPVSSLPSKSSRH